MRTMSHTEEQEGLFNWTIAYLMSESYPMQLLKDQKRAVRRRALMIEVDNGEAYMQ